MTLVLLLVSLVATQLLLAGEAWLGSAAPDPLVGLAAFAGLYGGRRSTLVLALAAGWARASVLLTPAGGAVLAVWLAAAMVVSQRSSLNRRRWTSFAVAALVSALGLFLADQACRWLTGQALADPVGLLAGTALCLPLAGVARAFGELFGDGA